MSITKKQHFVPRFYLENFSPDGGKAICSFDIQSKQHAETVSVESQCYEIYFYGKDGEVEKALADGVDGPSSAVIRSITKAMALPSELSADMAQLCMFVAFQRSRTAYATEIISGLVHKFTKHIAKTFCELNPALDLDTADLDNMKFTVNNPTGFAMHHCGEVLPYFSTLKAKLYLNKTALRGFEWVQRGWICVRT